MAAMNVTIVCPPALTVTGAVPVARLLLTSSPAGNVLTPASTVLGGIVSVMIAVPAGTVTGAPHVPAGIVSGVPATLKLKGAFGVMPAPATLQTCKKPEFAGGIAASMNVTIVCPPALTVTVAVPVARLLL